MVLADATHLSAQVLGGQVHRDAMRLEESNELVSDLDPDSLLDGEAPREDAHQARELGDADDLLVRDVPDECVSVKRQRMVFTQRKELDRPVDQLADAAVGSPSAFGWKRGQDRKSTRL